MSGTIQIPDSGPGQTFSFLTSDDVPFAFEIFNADAPPEDAMFDVDGNFLNPTTANPLPLGPDIAVVSGAGTTDASGVLDSGELVFDFTAPPFSNNGARIFFDLETGDAEGFLFNDIILFLRLEGAWQKLPPDFDQDGVADSNDNCIEVPNPDQYDSNADGFGNACDADINNDLFIDFFDVGLLKQVFLTNSQSPNWNPDADFNNDDMVDFLDLGIIKAGFLAAPGPSGIAP